MSTDCFMLLVMECSESELLEHSMISSMDTDLIPQDYISHCDALLQSFSARYAPSLCHHASFFFVFFLGCT